MDQINETDFTTINTDVVTEDHIESAHDSDELEHNEAHEDVFNIPLPFSTQDNIVYFEGSECPEEIMDGVACVTDAACNSSGDIFYTIQTRDLWSREREIEVDAQDLASDTVVKRLQQAGLIVHKPSRVRALMKLSAAQLRKRGLKTLLDRVGWHGEDHAVFNTGDGYFIGEGVPDHFKKKISPRVKMRTRDDLEAWQREIGVHVVANDIPLFASCFALSSVLLDRANLGTMAANFFGHKGKGKTLTLQLAASIFGNGSDPALGALDDCYISRFSATKNALEPLMGSYGCLPAILDEFGASEITDMGRTIYLLAGGSGKERMTSTGGLADRATWLLHILLSGEVSIAEHITATGKVQKGGQADRAADIPLPETGVFSELGGFASFTELTGHLKRACGLHYGTVGEMFVAMAVDEENRKLIAHRLATLPAHVNRLAPTDSEPGERRVVQHFALSAIAGMLAVDFGLFECDHGRILDAHQTVTDLWWRYRANSVDKVKDHIRRNADDIIVGTPTVRDGLAPAIIDHHNRRIVIPVEVFKAVFDDHDTVASELAEMGILLREQAGRHVSRLLNNKLRAYCVELDRFADLLKELGLDKPRP